MRSSLLGLLLLVACGGEAPPAVPPPIASTAPVEAPPVAASAMPPAPPVTNDPTVLTEEQQRRDAARVPLATTVVGAYPNTISLLYPFVGAFAPDGKHFLYGSLRDGLPEMYLSDVTKPADAPRPITSGPERATFATYTRDGKFILFLRDNQGDEQHHVWWVAADGTGAVDLTPGEVMWRGGPQVASGKPDTMVYTARHKAKREGLVLVQRVAGGDPKLVHSGPLPIDLADVRNDGARALVREYHSHGDTVLQEVDLTSGDTRRVYPAEGAAHEVMSAAYAGDGRRIFVTTDEGSEKAVLLALDAKTGKEVGRYVHDDPPTAALSVRVSPRHDLLALQVDCGTHGELRILDAQTLKAKRSVPVPLGEVRVGDWRRDGKGFAIGVSGPEQPFNPFFVDAETGSLTPLRDDKRAGLDTLPPIQTSVARATAFDGLAIPINVYLPKTEPGTKLPTLINFHGGPTGSYGVRWSIYTRFFVSLGYAVLEPNVRGSTGFGRAFEAADDLEKRADWLKDLEAVNAWTKSQPWCDPARVVVWGQSYGGYTTLMALTRQPALWRAGVDLYGPADLTTYMHSTTGAARSVMSKEFGDPDQPAGADVLARFSPLRDVDKITAPLFVYAGQNDPRVPRDQSDAVVMALRRRNVPVEYMVAANEGHSVDRAENKIALLVRTARFLEDALK